MNATNIKNDTLTILICSQIHKALSVKSRAIKIAKCCKIMRDKAVVDKYVYNVYKTVIESTKRGNYKGVVQWCDNTEIKYNREY